MYIGLNFINNKMGCKKHTIFANTSPRVKNMNYINYSGIEEKNTVDRKGSRDIPK